MISKNPLHSQELAGFYLNYIVLGRNICRRNRHFFVSFF